MTDTIAASRSVEELIARTKGGKKPEFVFFTEHRSVVRGQIGLTSLSQWFPSPFRVNDVAYRSAEQFMMASKARLFGDDEIEGRIMAAPTPKAAHDLGLKVQGVDESVWKQNREQIVTDGNRAKFAEDDEARAVLLATGNHILALASPTDTVWGIGVDALDLRSGYPERWRGINLLGFVLMAVRSELASG